MPAPLKSRQYGAIQIRLLLLLLLFISKASELQWQKYWKLLFIFDAKFGDVPLGPKMLTLLKWAMTVVG